jgi:hypothetical protein
VDDEGKKIVVAYTSHSNNETKTNYSSTKGHLVGIWAMAHF